MQIITSLMQNVASEAETPFLNYSIIAEQITLFTNCFKKNSRQAKSEKRFLFYKKNFIKWDDAYENYTVENLFV